MRGARATGPLLLAATAVAVLSSCGPGETQATAPRDAAPWTPERALVARLVLAEWLECSECVDGELDAVLRLGPRAVPSLAAALRDGPSPATRELLRRRLRTLHAELRERARDGSGSPIEIEVDVWIDEQVASHRARYQIRSAEALAGIGGPDAAAALRGALAGGPLQPGVDRVVRGALERVGEHR